MNDHLSIVRKADFVDLFKYGRLYVSRSVTFNGDIAEHSNDEELFRRLTWGMNMYEYSYEYVVLHFLSEQREGETILVDIRDVQGVLALDEEARRQMTLSFDPRIRVGLSPWTRQFNELHGELLFRQCMRGVDNIRMIFGLTDDDIAKCKAIVTDDTIREVFRQFLSNEEPSGELPLWHYLLRYERHSSYPKDERGFFCDLVHVACNWSKRTTIHDSSPESTDAYRLITASKCKNFNGLVKELKASSLAKLTREATGCEFVKAGSLFLSLKAEFAEGMRQKPEARLVAYTKDMGLEGRIALYLLGVTLGYDKTYDALYDVLALPLFKRCDPVEPGPKPEPKHPSHNGKAIQTSLIDEPFIVWMRKVNEKDMLLKPTTSEEQMGALQREGYEPVKKFTALVSKKIKELGFDPDKEKKLHSQTMKGIKSSS